MIIILDVSVKFPLTIRGYLTAVTQIEKQQ